MEQSATAPGGPPTTSLASCGASAPGGPPALFRVRWGGSGGATEHEREGVGSGGNEHAPERTHACERARVFVRACVCACACVRTSRVRLRESVCVRTGCSRVRVRVRAYVRMCVRAHAHVRAHSYVRVSVRAHSVRSCTYVRVRARVPVRVCICVCMPVRVRECAHRRRLGGRRRRRERKRAWARVRLRVRVCVCVCVRRRRLAAALSNHGCLGTAPQTTAQGSRRARNHLGTEALVGLQRVDTTADYRRPRDHLAGLERRRAHGQRRRSENSRHWVRLERRRCAPAHTDTLLNSAARAIAETCCMGITSTQPVRELPLSRRRFRIV